MFGNSKLSGIFIRTINLPFIYGVNITPNIQWTAWLCGSMETYYREEKGFEPALQQYNFFFLIWSQLVYVIYSIILTVKYKDTIK